MSQRRYVWLLLIAFLLGACAIPGTTSSSGQSTPAQAHTPAAVATQTAVSNTSGEVKSGTWERDDPKNDLLSCSSGDPVPASQSSRLGSKIYVDVVHATLKQISLKDPTVAIKGKMCAYQITLDYGRPIDTTGLLEGSLVFTGGRVSVEYTFNINNNKFTWEGTATNTDSHAAIHPDNFQDFGMEVQGNTLVLSIPCHAVPRADDQTEWHLTTFNTKSSGGRWYCDEVGSGMLPKPKVYWDGKTAMTIKDAPDDIMDLTHKTNNLPLNDADILELQTSLAPRNAPVTMQLASFPPNEDLFTWRAVLRMNMSLVGPGQLLCGRDEDGRAGFIDPKSLALQPDNGLATFQATKEGPSCTFAPPTFAKDGCIIVSADFYLKDNTTKIQYKDRVNGALLCYQQK
ncbi:MAG TPA: hypothetical protein ENJ54_03155 [Chloroflexi bacterium]|nr:hypothetical protein [Chloroflexota bacterium]